jgi:hypothetical protein
MDYEIAGLFDDDDSSGQDMAVMGEVLGYDDQAILGAMVRANNPRTRAALSKAITARKLKSSNVVYQKEYTQSGMEPLGFVSLAIGIGATVTISTQPQKLFKPLRLVVPSTVAPFFTIDNIIVGTRSQFPSLVPIPAEMFIPEAEDVDLVLDTVQPAINLSLVVTNISGAIQNFRAGFKGKSVG